MANWYWYVEATHYGELNWRNLEALTKPRYGFHVPRTVARDNFYAKLEEQRAADKQEQ